MKLGQSVRLGGWLLIALNFLMALGAIWIFMRMAPAIELIIERNERSLHACEEMLQCLVMANQEEANRAELRQAFLESLEGAQNNITEKEEPLALEEINANYVKAFEGNQEATEKTVFAITRLSAINRGAMIKADQKARQFGSAGAWGIVFMATAIFTIGMIFMKSLKYNLVRPLKEIDATLQEFRGGNTFRRCVETNTSPEVKKILRTINELLDTNMDNYRGIK
ncbi:MAG TPA: hypothetical protein PK364_03690 [Synergistaceae bacterium]|nr:hypothetical protein [Synergistaceae bacterium]HPJ25813.1 hypothetical protein [Synergistaceae bacterium]HPQ37450.1 hypothetical protein [Synergistaceae bacterium]